MPTQSYEITPAQFSAYLGTVAAEGFALTPSSPNAGRVNGRGVTIDYVFTGAMLNLTGISKPFFVSWGYVWSLILEHLS